MKLTEQLTPETIREFLEIPGPCATIVLAGNEAGDTSIELKHALNTVKEECKRRGINAEAFGGPIEAAVAAEQGNTKNRGSVVVLRTLDDLAVLHAAGPIKPIVDVAEHFHLRTLLSVVNATKSFYILALSQNRTRMLRCTESSSEEVALPGVAVSLSEAMQTRKPDHVLDNRASAGPSMGAGGGVMFGTSTDADDKDEYLLHFFMQLDKGVNAALKGRSEPLIPVGVEHEIALYGRVNSYGHLCVPGIHGAPDGLEGGEMHRRALQLLEQKSAQPGSDVLTDFDKKVGTGHASTHIHEIVQAAWEGRVSHLLMQENAEYMGTYDPIRQRVKHTSDPLDSPVDLVELSACQTVLHGGIARILPGSAMPNGVPVCALFRYAIAQPVSASNVETAA